MFPVCLGTCEACRYTFLVRKAFPIYSRVLVEHVTTFFGAAGVGSLGAVAQLRGASQLSDDADDVLAFQRLTSQNLARGHQRKGRPLIQKEEKNECNIIVAPQCLYARKRKY